MIFPIHGIAFALCAGPIQTSLSRLTAASPEKGRAFLRVSLALSLSIALPLTSLIYTFADFLAARVLLAPECAPLLPHSPSPSPSVRFMPAAAGIITGSKNGSPGIFTGGRAVHPHFLRPADRPCLPHEQDSYHGATGCLGAVDRGSGIGGVLSAGLWMLEACCHTAKYRHAYFQLFSSNTKKYHPFSILIPFYTPLYPMTLPAPCLPHKKKSEPRLRFLNRMICFADPLEGRFQILFEFVFQFLHVPSIKTRCCTENAVHLELTKKPHHAVGYT